MPEELPLFLICFNLVVMAASCAVTAVVIRKLTRDQPLVPFVERESRDAGGVFTWVRRMFRPQPPAEEIESLPVPPQISQIRGDLALGLGAFLTAFLPVMALQAYLAEYFMKYEHPLVNQMQQDHSLQAFFYASLTAVVIAPLLEELIFRNVLQGFFEVAERQLHPPDSENHRWPYGALPILLSSTVFAGMHWQHGAAAAPLFLFAMVLDYLYYQTHRLLPSIVAHAALNAFSMVQLWFLQ